MASFPDGGAVADAISGVQKAPFQAFKRRRLGAVAGLLAGIPQ